MKLLLVLADQAEFLLLEKEGLLRALAARYKLVLALADDRLGSAFPAAGGASDCDAELIRLPLGHTGNGGGARFALPDYLPVSPFDRIDRLPQFRRCLGRLFAKLRWLELLLRTAVRHPGCVLGIVRAAGHAAPSRLGEVLDRERPWLVVASHQLAGAVRTSLARAVIARRIPTAMRSQQDWKAIPREIERRLEAVARRVWKRESASQPSSISELYGAKRIVAAYCGLAPDRCHIPGYWMHGWIPSFHNVHPALIALHKGGSDNQHRMRPLDKSALQLVSRPDQEEYLRSCGYAQVRAIGLPIVYLGGEAVPRTADSLLVMPPHSQVGRTAEDPLVRRYAETIAELAKDFASVRLCVSNDDFIKENWWPAFLDVGIDNIVGSEPSDPDAHLRMRDLLSRFEYVTTNGFGSHIAYAAYYGAKVSIFGPFAEQNRQTMRRAHAVQMFPELLDLQIELCSERALRNHYPQLFTRPRAALQHVEWARAELGFACRLTPGEMRALVAAPGDGIGRLAQDEDCGTAWTVKGRGDSR